MDGQITAAGRANDLRASRLTLRLTPAGHLVCDHSGDAPEMNPALAARLTEAFSRGEGQGLLHLGGAEIGQTMPPVFVWWRSFAARYVGALCLQGGETAAAVPEPDAGELATLVLTAPMMAGAEYLTAEILLGLWAQIGLAVAAALAGTDLPSFLQALNPAWNLVGRVHFNLAENKADAEAPFAFMATHTTQLSAHGRAQHLPLGQALREYAGASNRKKLLALLMPVQRAAQSCEWLRPMVDAGEIYHPLRWTPAEATRLLADAEALERAGVVVRLPPAWRTRRPPRPQVAATIGARPPSKLGLDGLLDFRVGMTLEGEALDEDEIAALLAGTDGLVLLRGQWVEVDRKRIEATLAQFQQAEALSRAEGLSFAEAMRMLAGPSVLSDKVDNTTAEWSKVTAGPWLAKTLSILRTPDAADWVEESWITPSSREAMITAFQGWHPRLHRLFALAPSVFKWGLFDRDPLPQRTRGCATLLGDAAHPMLPYLSQGAGMAIEDGYVLARLLARGDKPQAALQFYEQMGRPRTSRVQDASRATGRAFHLASPWARLRRDLKFAVRHFTSRDKGFETDWLYAHDVTNEDLTTKGVTKESRPALATAA